MLQSYFLGFWELTIVLPYIIYITYLQLGGSLPKFATHFLAEIFASWSWCQLRCQLCCHLRSKISTCRRGNYCRWKKSSTIIPLQIWGFSMILGDCYVVNLFVNCDVICWTDARSAAMESRFHNFSPRPFHNCVCPLPLQKDIGCIEYIGYRMFPRIVFEKS